MNLVETISAGIEMRTIKVGAYDSIGIDMFMSRDYSNIIRSDDLVRNARMAYQDSWNIAVDNTASLSRPDVEVMARRIDTLERENVALRARMNSLEVRQNVGGNANEPFRNFR